MSLFDRLSGNTKRAADIAAAGGIGLWEWDIATERFWFSDYAKLLLHVTGGEIKLAEVQARLYPEDHSVFVRAFQNIAESAESFEVMARAQSKGDSFHWLRWRGQVRQMSDGFRLTGTIQDVHEERLTQLELEFTQEMLNEAQRIARLGSWQYDIASDRIFWSAATFHIFGRDIALGPPQGDTQARYFDADDFRMLNSKTQNAIQSGHPYQCDLHAARDDGHTIIVRVIGRPIFDRMGRASLVIGTMQDITDWADLQQAQARAEEKQRTQNQFLANVRHEIHTPMNAIFGMAQMLLMTPLPPQQAEQAWVILTAARDLLTIIDNLLDLSKAESGHMNLENVIFDLQEQLGEVVALHASKIYNKGLEFLVNFGPDVPSMLEGDPTRLKQVIGNLISNAEKFTRQGHIIISVTTEGSAALRQIIRFAVIDTGIDIPSHHLESVFQKDFQAAASTARQYGGSSLGLAICAELVDLMGGEIHVTSDQNSGTCFWFDIPMHAVASDMPLVLNAKVLVLEPLPLAAENIATQLKSLGADVVMINDKHDLAPNLAKHPFSHVLVADHTEYDANIIAAEVRKEHHDKGLKLILLMRPTAQIVSHDAFDAVIGKPTLPNELRRILQAPETKGSPIDPTALS